VDAQCKHSVPLPHCLIKVCNNEEEIVDVVNDKFDTEMMTKEPLESGCVHLPPVAGGAHAEGKSQLVVIFAIPFESEKWTVLDANWNLLEGCLDVELDEEATLTHTADVCTCVVEAAQQQLLRENIVVDAVPQGCERLWMTRTPSPLGTAPMGETEKKGKGGCRNGPAFLPSATSLSICSPTKRRVRSSLVAESALRERRLIFRVPM